MFWRGTIYGDSGFSLGMDLKVLRDLFLSFFFWLLWLLSLIWRNSWAKLRVFVGYGLGLICDGKLRM